MIVGRRLVVLLAILVAVMIPAFIELLGDTPPADALGKTTCPWIGGARVEYFVPASDPDAPATRKHEEVHVAQCRDLGPLRFRLRNVTGRGKLTLEAPAYCAGARARLAQRLEPAMVRMRLVDDAQSAFTGEVDTALVRAALRASCPEIVH